MDEPASGLDPRARVEMKEILKQLSEMGKTVIISSHILPELAEMCTEVGIIDHGRLVVQGSINEIMKVITKERLIYIKSLNKQEELLKIIKENANIGHIKENTSDIEFTFKGNDEELSEIVESAVKNGIKILSFHEEGNLEEIFMQVTGGEENA